MRTSRWAARRRNSSATWPRTSRAGARSCARRACASTDEGKGTMSGHPDAALRPLKSEIRDGMRIDWDVPIPMDDGIVLRSEEHTSELQSRQYLACRLLLEKTKKPFDRSMPPLSRTTTT